MNKKVIKKINNLGYDILVVNIKRRIDKQTRKETIQFIQDNIDNDSSINEKQLIYVSKDNKIIMYEDLQIEAIVVCDKTKIKNKTFKEIRYAYKYNIESLIWYLSDFLDTFYSSKFANKIIKDFLNTDLEEYEEYKVMKWSE